MWFLEELIFYYFAFMFIVAVSDVVGRKKRKKKKKKQNHMMNVNFQKFTHTPSRSKSDDSTLTGRGQFISMVEQFHWYFLNENVFSYYYVTLKLIYLLIAEIICYFHHLKLSH